MLQEMQMQDHQFNSVNLIYGTRKQEDLIYRDDISNWNEQIRNFKSHICLSREQATNDSDPKGSIFHQGYVHDAYKEILNHNSYDKSTCLFMICGWSEMIDQAVLTLFSELGFSREQK